MASSAHPDVECVSEVGQCVSNGRQRPHIADGQAQQFRQSAVLRHRGASRQGWELPHPGPASGGRALFDEPPSAMADAKRPAVLGRQRARSAARWNPMLQILRVGSTQRAERAVLTVGRARGADHCAQFHKSRVELPGPTCWDQIGGKAPKLAPHGRGTRIAAQRIEAAQDTGNIAVKDRLGLVVGDGRDGPGGVRADPADFSQIGGFSRNHSTMFGVNTDSGLEQVAGAAVIAQPLPEPQEALFIAAGQVRKRGEVCDEPAEVGDDGLDPRLLKHYFTDQHVIGVRAGMRSTAPGRSPRQVPSVAAVPADQPAADAAKVNEHLARDCRRMTGGRGGRQIGKKKNTSVSFCT